MISVESFIFQIFLKSNFGKYLLSLIACNPALSLQKDTHFRPIAELIFAKTKRKTGNRKVVSAKSFLLSSHFDFLYHFCVILA